MTRSPLYCFCFAVAVFLSAPGYAQKSETNPYTSLSVGPRIYHHEYGEPGIMENRGWFAGVGYSLTYENRFFASLDGIISYGNVDYISTRSGNIDDKDGICSDTRLLLGYAVFDSGTFKIIPYAGIAYRYLMDDMEGMATTKGYSGYLRESNYVYSPVGVRLSYQFKNGWFLRPSAEYDYFWFGKQESYLGSIAGYEDIDNDQNDDFGFRAMISLEKEMQTFRLGFDIFYRYWDIDRSDITTDSQGRRWAEPANDTREIGIGLTFRF